MIYSNINFDEARNIAIKAAHDSLRALNVSSYGEKVLNEFYIETDVFWIFYRNREIHIPPPETGLAAPWAFMVSKIGSVLYIKDNLDDQDQLEEQILGLSDYIRKKQKDGCLKI